MTVDLPPQAIYKIVLMKKMNFSYFSEKCRKLNKNRWTLGINLLPHAICVKSLNSCFW